MLTKVRIFAAIVVLLIASPIHLATGSAVLISDIAMTVMVELSSRHPFCKMHTDRGDIQRMLLQSDPRRIRQVPRESVLELEDVCKDSGSHGMDFRGGLGFIYPGTKWCGPGTTASDYNDLGQHTDEDRCCREHDLCPNVLNVGECRRGLCNTGTFTRSHCDCDARLRRCLQSLNTETANTLGAIFYNVVQVTCFQERSPCSPHQRFEDFFHKTTHCTISFQPANLYVPPSLVNFISRLAKKFANPNPPATLVPTRQLFVGRSLQVDPPRSPTNSLREKFDQFTTRIGVKIASVGLAAVNIFKEIVNSPRVVWESLHFGAVNRNIPPYSNASPIENDHDDWTSPRSTTTSNLYSDDESPYWKR